MIPLLRNISLAIALAFLTLGTAVHAQQATPAFAPSYPHWWTAWSSCDITPVQRAPKEGKDPTPTNPAPIGFLPWLEAESTTDTNSTIVVSLWTGDRPLPVDGEYDDGNNAKWLWILSDDLDDLRITAINENGTNVEFNDLGRVLSSSTGSNEWPSIIDLPESGCWTFNITATSIDGTPYEGRIVFPAVP